LGEHPGAGPFRREPRAGWTSGAPFAKAPRGVFAFGAFSRGPVGVVRRLKERSFFHQKKPAKFDGRWIFKKQRPLAAGQRIGKGVPSAMLGHRPGKKLTSGKQQNKKKGKLNMKVLKKTKTMFPPRAFGTKGRFDGWVAVGNPLWGTAPPAASQKAIGKKKTGRKKKKQQRPQRGTGRLFRIYFKREPTFTGKTVPIPTGATCSEN